MLQEAGHPAKEYANYLEYPDEEFVGIMEMAAQIAKKSTRQYMMDFGTFLGEDLIRIYQPLINREWSLLEVFMNTEETIHEVVRVRNTQARPPALHFSKESEHSVILTYGSKRGLCALAKGIAMGISNHYQEQLYLGDLACVGDGDDTCRIRFSTRAPEAE